MSIAALLALMVAPVAQAPVPEEQPIVVIGKRLATWRGRMVKANGGYRCRTVHSTGDAAIDAIGCQALLTCTAPVQPKLDTIIAMKLPKADRQRRLQAEVEAEMPCLKAKRDALVQELADRRAAG